MVITTAGNNVLRCTAQGILLVVVVRGTDDGLRTVKLPIVLVPGLKRNLLSSSAAAKKGVRTIIKQKGSSLDLGAFSVQLTRSGKTRSRWRILFLLRKLFRNNKANFRRISCVLDDWLFALQGASRFFSAAVQSQ